MSRHVLLYREDVSQVSVEPLRPEVPASCRVDKLRRDPDPAARFPNASFEDIAHAEALADLADVYALTREDERRIAGDDEQLGQLRQRSDDVFRKVVG
jgi:hypothetical protein